MSAQMLAEETYLETPWGQMLTGHIELQHDTGWTRDPDGWWSTTGTPTIHYNGRGEITKVIPHECYIRMDFGDSGFDPVTQTVIRKRKWWRFWERAA